MTELVLPDRLVARQDAKQFAALQRAGRFNLAVVDQETDLGAARVNAVAHVSKTAMFRQANVTEVACQLSALVPEAAQQLQGIANLTAVALAEIVTETARRVR